MRKGWNWQRRLLTVMGNNPLSVAFNAYVATLAPLLEYRLNIASGTTIPNTGSLGSAQDGTLTLGAGLLAQSSPLGAGEAIKFDGADTKIAATAVASITTPTARSWVFLHNPLSLGENSGGAFWHYANLASGFGGLAAGFAVSAGVYGSGTNASTTSAAAFATQNSWQMTFFEIDFAGDLKLHLYKGISGAVSEPSYASQIAAIAPPSSFSTQLNFGNRALSDNTWDGYFSRILIFNRLLTAPEKLTLTQLAGV